MFHTLFRVISSDIRIQEYFRLVAFMELDFRKKINGTPVIGLGTGFLCDFEGKRILMTAKHNVLDGNTRVDKVSVYFGRDGKFTTIPGFQIDGSIFKLHTTKDVAFADLSSYAAQLPNDPDGFMLEALPDGYVQNEYLEIGGYPGKKKTVEQKRLWRVYIILLFLGYNTSQDVNI